MTDDTIERVAQLTGTCSLPPLAISNTTVLLCYFGECFSPYSLWHILTCVLERTNQHNACKWVLSVPTLRQMQVTLGEHTHTHTHTERERQRDSQRETHTERDRETHTHRRLTVYVDSVPACITSVHVPL